MAVYRLKQQVKRATSDSDYYALLHVSPDAPEAVIRASYRTLMQKLKAHPDLGGDHALAARLNEAYAVLKDAGRRAEYDARRATDCAGPSGDPSQPGEIGPTPIGVWQQQADASGGDLIADCAFCGLAAGRALGQFAVETCSRCASPLRAAGDPRFERDSQRAIHRINRDLPIRLFTEWQDTVGIAATLIDVSLSGLQLSAGIDVPKDRRIKVDCPIFAAVARVAYCKRAHETNGGRAIVGAQFLTLELKRRRGALLSVPA